MIAEEGPTYMGSKVEYHDPDKPIREVADRIMNAASIHPTGTVLRDWSVEPTGTGLRVSGADNEGQPFSRSGFTRIVCSDGRTWAVHGSGVSVELAAP